MDACVDLERFIRGEVEAADFSHREHVRMGFEMLRRYDFATSAYRYSNAIRQMAARAGQPQAFHQTVTIAFLALVAERLETRPWADFDAFADANPELFERSVLQGWYSAEQLDRPAARRTFVLPDVVRAR